MTEPKLKHVYEIYIRTTPEKLWQAITDSSFTQQYFYAQTVESDWKQGSTYKNVGPKGNVMHEGRIVEVDPPRRLVQTFACSEHSMKNDRPSRVTWLLEKKGGACKLTLTHDDFDGETATYKSVGSGWNPVLSGLKTVLETGQALKIDET